MQDLHSEPVQVAARSLLRHLNAGDVHPIDFQRLRLALTGDPLDQTLFPRRLIELAHQAAAAPARIATLGTIPPERLGDATRRQLFRTLHETQEQVRRAAHALHDEYQPDQSRALYDLANNLGDIKALYEPRKTDVLDLGRRRAESVAEATS